MIDVVSITPRQKLIIESGLCDYRYIMKYLSVNDKDFQAVFYDFYLSARWAVMSKEGNKRPYFDLLQRIHPDTSLIDILIELKETMEQHSYEFSLASKMLHTINPMSPIYDSKVRDYLSKEEGISFWWNGTGAPRKTSELDKIRHDWELLNEWYKNILSTDRGRQWIKWFDESFPGDPNISDVKKIDFIIFATR